MGSSSSRTVDSVSKEINEIIEKIKDDKKRLEIFIQNRKTRATDQWSEDKESEDKEQMRLTGELAALKTRLTELNKELDGLQAASSANQQEDITSGFNLPIFQGGKKKKKNSKRKNSKRKNSKRKISKRKNSKRK